MKKIVLLIALSIITFSCKNSEEEPSKKMIDSEAKEVLSDNTIYKGDFIYTADAAVLKGDKFIYGVVLNDMATELAERVKPAKESDFDMVPVAIKGIVSPKPEGQEGWPEIITITEIIIVGDKPSKIDIKLEGSKE
ncbi:MAG: hypothetical protein L3J09_06855 [Flavobacteriaceae bacterium]|nr:hypothetical protein [Flavobacteriaceae bacterium]